jgi:hypothetical protein
VIIHPLVLGEICCGNLKNRTEVLTFLRALESEPVTDAFALDQLEQLPLYGCGLGFVDVHIIVSLLGNGTVELWARDKSLASAAKKLGVRLVEES